MRVRLIFNLINRGAEMPFHHQYIISELFTTYVADYIKTNAVSNKVFYNFSSLKGQTKISKEGLQYHSKKVSLIFSSNDPDLVKFLIQNIYKEPKIVLGKLILQPLSVDLENTVEFKNETKYICLSPLSIFNPIENHHDAQRYISPSFDLFSDALYENTMDRMEQAGSSAAEISRYFEFQLVPDKDYIDKMKSEQKKIARIYPVYPEESGKFEIRGYTFPFTLYAAPQVHEFIFNCGFGTLTNNGFGMLDIANEDPALRIVEYPLILD